MKKRIFALALALCMMVSVMPTSFANGVLTLGDGTDTDSNGVLTLDNGTSGRSTTTSGSVQPRQDGVLYGSGSEGDGTLTVDNGGENSGTLNGGTDTGITGGILGGESTSGGSTGDGTGGSAPADLVNDDANGLELSKTVSGNKITLEAFVTGQTVTVTQTTTKPMDIILILDTSKEMSGTTYGYEYVPYTGNYSLSSLRDANETLYMYVDGEYRQISVTRRGGWFGSSYEYTLRYRLGNNYQNVQGYVGVGGNTTYNGTLYRQQQTTSVSVSRLGALKEAANEFIDTIAAQTFEGNDVTRIALVKYAANSTVLSGSQDDNEEALVPVTAENATTLKGLINGLTLTNEAAYCNYGLADAKNIFQDANSGNYADRDRVVILLSAGVFGPSSKLNDSDAGDGETAMDMIWLSVILKTARGTNASPDFGSNFYGFADRSADSFARTYGSYAGCGATVYCVGLEMPTTVPTGGYTTSVYGDTASRINEIMYRVSSHRPDGTHPGSNRRYNPWEDDIANSSHKNDDWEGTYPDALTRNVNRLDSSYTSYFLTSDDASGLYGIFETISKDITTGGASNTTLTESTVVQDVISPYFQIPAGGTVTVHTETFTGTQNEQRTWAIRNDDRTWTVTPSGNTIQVDNFDFAENYVGYNNSTPHGKKLVIEIDIEANTNFLGGNGVATNNDAQAGVFNDQQLIENFPNTNATADIPVKGIDPVVANQNIYLSNEAALKALLSTTQDARINGTNNKYVEIVYTISDDNGVVGTYTIPQGGTVNSGTWSSARVGATWTPALEDDTTYSVTCTVDAGGTNKAVSGPKAAEVSVFKPVITFADSTIYLGEVPTYLGTNYTADDIAWFNGGTNAKTAKMRDTAPAATITFDPATKLFTECTPVNVTAVVLGDDNYNARLSDVTFKNGTSSHEGSETVDEFIVHVVKPVFSNTDTTIYLGNSVSLDGLMTEANKWVCGDGKELDKTDAPVKPSHTYSANGNPTGTQSVSPKTCTTYAVVTKVGSTVVDNTKNIDIHVIQPTITFADQDIYLSKTPTYAETAFTWNDICAKSCEGTIPDNNSTDTKDNFSYTYDPAADSFTECTDVNVTVKFGDEKENYTSYVTLKNGEETRGADIHEFTVHVYLPKIELESQNLWADYDVNVTLTDGMKDPTITGWVDQCGKDEATNLNGTPPQCSEPTYQFTLNGEAITEYNAKSKSVTDQATINVALGKIEIGEIEYDVADELPAVAAVDYNITVNKFDLTINKTWKDGDKDADGTYKQDAIFTVSGGLGDFQVVLPAGQESIEVTGLLCGQTYTVSEDEAWTWRWSAKQTDDITSHSHGVSTEAPTEHSDTSVTFENSLINRLWLSFCTFVQNIFGQAAIQKGGN